MSNFYKNDGTPIRCYVCGGDWLEDEIPEHSEHGIMEYSVKCIWCGHTLAYWSYGHFDPYFRFEENVNE